MGLLIYSSLLAQQKKQERKTNVQSEVIQPIQIKKNISKVGTTFALKEVLVANINAGVVEELFFVEGSKVKKGQIIAHVGAIDQKINLEEANSFLKQQKINLDFSEKNYKRQSKLYKKGIINLSQFEQIEAQYRINQTAHDSATLRKKRAEIDYNQSLIKSPISGIINQKYLEVGEFAKRGDPVYEIIKTDEIIIKFFINENELPKLFVGQKATITFDAILDKKYTGKISNISTSANTQTKTFEIELNLNNKNEGIYPGITSRILIHLFEQKPQILIPLSAIIESIAGKTVYLNQNSVAKLTAIQVGETIGDKVVVKNGLKAGDRLIVVGQQFLNENDPINDLTQ